MFLKQQASNSLSPSCFYKWHLALVSNFVLLIWYSCLLKYLLTSSCKSNNERTKGCQEVSISVDHIQASNVDVDRELSRIHALCVAHIEKFDGVLSEYLYLLRNNYIGTGCS